MAIENGSIIPIRIIIFVDRVTPQGEWKRMRATRYRDKKIKKNKKRIEKKSMGEMSDKP